jgi:hypothetical protein
LSSFVLSREQVQTYYELELLSEALAGIQFVGGIFGNFGTPSANVAQAGALEV